MLPALKNSWFPHDAGKAMDWQTLGMFTVASTVLAATPGPDMMLFVSRTMAQGRNAGFAALAGALLGCVCHAMAAGFGLSKLFVLVPVAFDVVRLAGAAYLLYLAWGIMRSSAPAAAQQTTPPLPLSAIMRQGLLTNILNPKVALFMLALLPQFMHPERGDLVQQVLILSAIQLLTGFLVNAVVICAAAGLAGWISQRFRAVAAGSAWKRRLPNLLLGGVFAGLAARLAWGGTK